jgi:hypothetical protein
MEGSPLDPSEVKSPKPSETVEVGVFATILFSPGSPEETFFRLTLTAPLLVALTIVALTSKYAYAIH